MEKYISYEGIYSYSVEIPAKVAKILQKFFRKRQILLEDQEDSRTGLPGYCCFKYTYTRKVFEISHSFELCNNLRL